MKKALTILLSLLVFASFVGCSSNGGATSSALAEKTAEAANLQSQLSEQANQISDLQSKVEAFSSEKDGLQSQIEKLTEENKDLQVQLEEQKKQNQQKTESSKTESSAAPAAQKENPTISIGDTIITNDYEFTLTNVEFTYELLPPNTSSVYTSYPAESGKVFVHIAADVKNTMQRDIRINELFESTVLYDGKYRYTGFAIVNDGDNRFDWVGSYTAATPLETCKAHNLVECPTEVDTSGKSVSVSIKLGRETYEYKLR